MQNGRRDVEKSNGTLYINLVKMLSWHWYNEQICIDIAIGGYYLIKFIGFKLDGKSNYRNQSLWYRL